MVTATSTQLVHLLSDLGYGPLLTFEEQGHLITHKFNTGKLTYEEMIAALKKRK